MALVFDRRDELGVRPGLHALVVGVSLYKHLPGGHWAQAESTFGLRQLSSTALSAFRLYQWLERHQDELAHPLATVRLLVAPSETELEVEPALRQVPHGCDLDDFRPAAIEWREDAKRNRDGVTLFSFTGHGIQRVKGDAIGLLGDFGDGQGHAIDKAFDSRHLYNGMAPGPKQEQIALTQLYFLDCCRVPPEELRGFEHMDPASLWSVDLNGIDDRRAPIFYGAVPGARAYALRGEATFMNRALIASLDGGAAELQEDDDGQERWCVSYYGLMGGLQGYIQTLNEDTQKDQVLRSDGFGEDAVIRFLDGPPSVDLVLRVEPDEAVEYALFEVLDDIGRPVDGLPAPLDPHPFTVRIPAGIYTINARIVPPHEHFIDRRGRARPIRPPRHPCVRRVLA